MASHQIEIIKELRALEQFCTFKTVRSAEDQERFLKDYLADLRDFPFEAIQSGCAKWRQSGQTRFPTPGQLLPLIRAALPLESAPRYEPWAPLSDAEYQALSLPEKIRHHRILAAEARRKAGPMWRNPPTGAALAKPIKGHVTAEAMPDKWRRWSDIAGGHEAEAKRLSGYLHRKPIAAE